MRSFFSQFDWNAGWNSFSRGFVTVVFLGFLVIGIPGAMPSRNDTHFQTLGAARDHLFDFVDWEIAAGLDKASIAIVDPARYMTVDEQTQYVRDYLDLVTQIHNLEDQITLIYTDPAISDADSASADLRSERDALRVQQQEQQAIAESIIEGQIGEMLVEHGFGIGGQIAPPVAIRFTRLPTILIVSPRDRIERIGSYALEHGLTVDEMDHVEDQITDEQGVSAIIAPLGGLAVYPSMLIETGYLPHVYNVGAHEWAHHYLTFFPLGINYGVTPELFTINETVASIVGEDIGWAVLDRYYPDLAGAQPDYTPQEVVAAQPAPPAPSPDPSAFDFRVEMRETRIFVDELLKQGKIEEAESYMEARRVMFVENGYQIRKLNQAYFAFHGSYADEPGATGSDPIGPALRELRYYSGSLIEFLHTVRGITTVDELNQALAEAKATHD